jgi:N-acyl-D-aspartate/D-glutamate deacylase
MPEFDTAIRGGTIVDGLRTPRFVSDVGLKDGRIAYIGPISAHEAARTIDASGLIVAPGFVDLHTHYDSQVYWDPYCTISGWHGVTSVVIGNCGFGFAPCKPDLRDRAMLTMERNEAVPLACMKEGMPWDWETYPEFLDSLDRTPKGINLVSYVGLNPLLMYGMGLEAAKARPATVDERESMCRLLEEAMLAGACGFSAQLLGENSIQRDYDGTPMITDTMSKADLLAFASVLRKVRRGFIQVAGANFKLAEELAEVSGRPVIFNLIALTTDQHGVTMANYRDVIRWLDDANGRGLRIFGQAVTTEIGFEFTLKNWNLFDTSPLWRDVTLGSVPERMAKMSDPVRRAALRAEYDAGRGPVAGGGTEAGGRASGAIAELVIEGTNDESLKRFDGHSIAELAAEQGKHPVDAMLDLAVADGLETTFVTPPRPIDLSAMSEVANSAYAIPGVSDGGAHTKFITLGAYPTEFLANLVRDGQIMDLEQAHWRLSTYPAMAAGFRDRGWIREGAPADIVVYDLEKLSMGKNERAYDFPANEWRLVRRPTGYRHILVNGEETFTDGVCSGATPGRLLRHGTA